MESHHPRASTTLVLNPGKAFCGILKGQQKKNPTAPASSQVTTLKLTSLMTVDTAPGDTPPHTNSWLVGVGNWWNAEPSVFYKGDNSRRASALHSGGAPNLRWLLQ
ncbi:hypothetical protein H1C71_023382 [Ictidomys tridecemlineatus]|nr:hypothetical protein H1C71_023382 [Ictidomys tridecemlineatus]